MSVVNINIHRICGKYKLMNIIMDHKEDYQTGAVSVLLINNISKLTLMYSHINLTYNEKSSLWINIWINLYGNG